MKFSEHNWLVSYNLLLQFLIFMVGQHACNSVTYYTSNDTCKGEDLSSKCKDSGGRVARIGDQESLIKAKSVIKDGVKYWTGLSRHHNKDEKYFWYKDENLPAHDEINPSILKQPKNGWKCYSASKSEDKLEPEGCGDRYHYICEKDSLPSSEVTVTETNLVSTQPKTSTWTKPPSTTPSEISTSDVLLIDTVKSSQLTVTETKPVSSQPTTSKETESTSTTVMLEISTSNALKLTAITTMLTPETSAITPTTVGSSGFITSSQRNTLIASTALPSSTTTTAMITVKETITLTTTGVVSSITEPCNKSGTTLEKQTTKKRLESYIEKMKALEATERGSLQNAATTTSTFFEDLKNNQGETNDINVLVATQELESFAIDYGKLHFTTNESTVISKKNYAMKIKKVPAETKDAVVFSVNETDYSGKDGWAIISLPPGTFAGKDAVVVFILYNDIKQLVPDEKHVELDGHFNRSVNVTTNSPFQDYIHPDDHNQLSYDMSPGVRFSKIPVPFQARETFTNLELQSRIVASTVDPKPPGILKANVTISFILYKESKEKDVPHCVFWNFTIKSEMNGSWSGKGCSLVKKVNKEVTCTCNHLTNFAVLMQVGGNKEVSSDHRKALEVISYVGCALSLTGEVLTFIAYCVLMNLKQEQIQIRLNLVVAIAIAQIVFLSGIGASERKEVCVFVAALIHYFYLAGFAWMLFEGVYLYLMVVKVFNTVVGMRLFYAVAWGVPFMVVVLSLVIASSQDGGIHSYVHGDFCWVSFTNNLVWTFVTPVLVVCLTNVVILGRVVHEIVTIQSNKTSELDRMRQGAKACVVLFPLLGMTWVFGVLSVTKAGLAFQYIFTILNSLQGFFIFVLHVLRNGDVRAAFHRKKQKWLEVKSVTSSRTTHHDSSNMWTHKVSSEANEMRSMPSHATPRPANGYSNQTLVLPQERTMTPVDT